MAFLFAYDGYLKGAIQQYRQASKSKTKPEILPKIEEFIVWLLREEPDKYQLYYCLGYINRNIKGDDSLAIKDFENFLKYCPETNFAKERELAEKWIQEMKNKLE